MLCFLDILVRRVVQVADSHLHIRPHKAGLCERRSIGDGKGNVQQVGEMGQQRRLAAAGGPQHDDVGFLDIGVTLMLKAILHALIVIVDRHGEDFLRVILVDNVLIQIFLDFMGLVLGQQLSQPL